MFSCKCNQNCFNSTSGWCRSNETLTKYECGCIYNDSCLISGSCKINGELSTSKCLYCNTDYDKTAWSYVDDDTTCDDGNATTPVDICVHGACEGHMNETISSVSSSAPSMESSTSSAASNESSSYSSVCSSSSMFLMLKTNNFQEKASQVVLPTFLLIKVEVMIQPI